jgi:glycosyltransferase involved in cell wall biosynthesis
MFRGAVLVLSPHGAFHPAVLTKSSVVVKRVYLSLARRVLYRCVDACHALSPAEADHIGALLGGVRVYTAPQGTNPHMGAAWGAEGKTRERKDCVRFVCVGRLDVYTKGLDILVEAFSAAIRRIGHERLQLTMVGPDWRGGRDWLNKKAKALGVGHLVRFTSGVPTRGVAEHLGESDVYIQLSRHDGFPLAVAEGLCAGKPAILSREIGTVSYPEISCLSHVRIVCPELENVVSTILEFSENVDRLTKQAWSAREEVRRFFDWRRSAQKHLDEYEALCQSARPASHG